MITKKLRQELLTLSPSEKTEIIQLLDGINKTPKVVGGAARIRNTRIPVWSLFQSHQMGTSDLDILEAHLDLTQTDLLNAWLYAETFPDEIEQEIAVNEAD
ncbi:DUF433 domain-containing protein [Chamaesiphon sp. GL140_3_metabinner_50]|uniref:DUF433 domain-containing protein n=1 Tax=Chamaesiphon sp. GL140_3_metabinner_50 TaxID=2970812 RepID=UPI0034574B56